MSEVDRLEVQIEASAKEANAELDKLISKLDKVASTLSGITGGSKMDDMAKSAEKMSKSTSGIKSQALDVMAKALSNLGSSTGGVKKATKGMKELDKKTKSIDASKIDEFKEKFKDIGKDADFSNLNTTQTEKEIDSIGKKVQRFKEQLEEKVSTGGTEKSIEKIVMKLQRATNQSDMLKNHLESINTAKMKSIDDAIARNNNTGNQTTGSVDDGFVRNTKGSNTAMASGDVPESLTRSVKDAGTGIDTLEDKMDQLAFKFKNVGNDTDFSDMGIQEAESLLAKLETQIVSLQARIEKKISLGGNLDKSAQSLMYDFEKATNEADALRSHISGIKVPNNMTSGMSGLSTSLEKVSVLATKVSSLMSSFKKKIVSAMKFSANAVKGFATNSAKYLGQFGRFVKSPIKALNKLLSKFKETKREFGRGMSIPRMVGMSVIYSSVFGMISGIKQALADGSNNLVQYSNQYNRSISSIVSSLSFLKNAWIAAFAPIINAVAPYLQAFVDMIANALNQVGKFFAALTGKGFTVQAVRVAQDYGSSLSDVGSSAGDSADGLSDADKAAKKYQRTLMGFDQINKLDDPTSSSGSGGGGSGGAGGVSPSDMFKTVEVNGTLSDFAKKLREAFKKEDWEGLGEILANGVNKGLQKLYNAINWSNVGPKISYFCNAFTRTMNSLVSHVDWNLMGRTVGAGINTIVNTLNLLITGFNWVQLGTKFSEGITGIFTEVKWGNLGALIGNKIMIVWNMLYGTLLTFPYALAGQSFGEGINGIFDHINFEVIAHTLSNGLNGLATMLQNFTSTVNWNKIATDLSRGVNDFIKNTKWKELGISLSNFATSMLGSIRKAVDEIDWEGLGKGVGDFLGNIDWDSIFSDVADIMYKSITGVLKGLFDSNGKVFVLLAGLFVGGKIASVGLKFAVFLSDGLVGKEASALILKRIGLGLSTVFSGLGTLITESLLPALSGVFTGTILPALGTLFTSIGSAIVTAVGAILTPIGLAIVAVVGTVIAGFLIWKNWDKIKNWAGNIKKAVVEKFNDAKSWLKEKGGNIVDGLKNGIEAVKDSKLGQSVAKFGSYVKTKAGDAKNWIKSKGSDAITGLRNGWDALKESKLGSEVAKAGNYIKGKLGNLREKLKSNGKQIINGLKDGLSGNWSTLGNYLSKIPSKIKSAIGNIYGKLKNVGLSAIRGFISGFRSLHIPTPHFFKNGSITFAGIKTPIPKIGVKWYAKGGMPNMGEMFVAREAGPELVGKIGNHNAVANNNQIVESVSSGVKEAVVEAMMMVGGATSGGQSQAPVIEVTVKAGEETLYKAVKKGEEKYNRRYTVLAEI